MSGIEYYFRPDEPLPLDKINITVSNEDFSEKITQSDRENVLFDWEVSKKEKGDKIFSSPRGLALLYSSSGGSSELITTEFMAYLALRNDKGKKLSRFFYENMRIVAVGGVLKSSDGKVLIHRRANNEAYSKGVLDASVAGLCQLKDGKIDFESVINEKLEREIGISSSEIKSIKFIGIHSSREPDFSGMFTFIIETNLSSEEMGKRASQHFDEYHLVPYENLSEFILDKLEKQFDLCKDGCATVTSSLPNSEFKEVVSKLRNMGRDISFGNLKEGKFIKN